jgi:hypothetical protein
MADGQTVSTQITGRAGIPADAVGVVANVTATNTTVPGFLTVFPDVLPQPLTSSLNFVGGEPGVPNLVMSSSARQHQHLRLRGGTTTPSSTSSARG